MANLEKKDKYRLIIKQILSQYATYKPANGNIDLQTIFDSEHDRYQVLAVGWEENHRVYGCSIHLDIKEDKIWIQDNNTEIDIAQELVTEGVPKDDIVIAFQPPYLRKVSGYGVV